jgi:hypothetical protein
MIAPKVLVRLAARARAPKFGAYPSSRTAFITRSRVSWLTPPEFPEAGGKRQLYSSPGGRCGRHALVVEAAAQTANEEREREQAAEHTMTLATAYVLGASRSYPIMQLDLKENIQNATNGKVYVKLAPGGQLGAGGALVQAVQGGTIQCAQHSLSNFAPFASAVDLINLPYFCGSNQRFTNLVNSDAWKPRCIPRSRPRASSRCSTSTSTRALSRCAPAARARS